jgi:DNA repair exonuclease SbcCD ATPase subunit
MSDPFGGAGPFGGMGGMGAGPQQTIQQIFEEMKKKAQEEKEREERERKKRILSQKHRHTQRLALLRACPLCSLKIANNEQMAQVVEGNEEFFFRVQYGSNMDNSGYETYHCGRCDMNFAFMISPDMVIVKPSFVSKTMKGKKGTPGESKGERKANIQRSNYDEGNGKAERDLGRRRVNVDIEDMDDEEE